MNRASRDAEFTEFALARLASLRRVAYLLCRDWDRADDVLQASLTKLYVHWERASADGKVEAYARAIVVREFLSQQRTPWSKRVTLSAELPESQVPASDRDLAMDVRQALAALPPRQRATLVLRFYCDFGVTESAQILGCTTGTVKSQTAKGLDALRKRLAVPERISNG